MRTQRDTRRTLILSVGFALACIVLTIATFAKFGGALPLGAHGYRVKIPLPDAQSVVVGSDVRTSGVKIGKVVAIGRARNRAIATVELQPRFVPMRAKAVAITRIKTLLGEGYIEVAPGPVDAAPIPENGSLAAAQVRRTVTLDDFLSTFSSGTRKQMRGLIRGIDGTFAGRGKSVNDAIAYSAPLTGDVNAVLRTVDGQGTQLQELVARSADVLDALGRRTGALQSAVRSADTVLAATARRDRELAATVHALPPFLRQVRAAAGAVGAAGPELDRAAASVTPLVAPLRGTIDQAIATGPAVQAVFRDLRPVIATARHRLPTLTRIVKAAPATLQPLYPALREAIPLLQLLALYRESALVGPLATVAAAANGKLVGPGGKIATHAGGTIYTANESVAGWVKRLPTDRSNPYPKPDGLLQMAKQGYLSSFDCRNVGNRLYLPPLGTGVPPCKTQGPWTYRGKTAYYPRLQQSPP